MEGEKPRSLSTKLQSFYSDFEKKSEEGVFEWPLEAYTYLEKKFKDVKKYYSQYTSKISKLKNKVKDIVGKSEPVYVRNASEDNLRASIHSCRKLYNFFGVNNNSKTGKKAEKIFKEVEKMKKSLDLLLAENQPDESGLIELAKRVFPSESTPRGNDTYLERIESFVFQDKDDLLEAMKSIENSLEIRRKNVADSNLKRGKQIVALGLIGKDIKMGMRKSLNDIVIKYTEILDILKNTEFRDRHGIFKGKEIKIVKMIDKNMVTFRAVDKILNDAEATLKYGEFVGSGKDGAQAVYGFMDSKIACKNFISDYSKLISALILGESLKSLKTKTESLNKRKKGIFELKEELEEKVKRIEKGQKIERSENRKFISDINKVRSNVIGKKDDLKKCSDSLDKCKDDLLLLITEHKKYHSLTGRLKRAGRRVKRAKDDIFDEIGKTTGLLFKITKDIMSGMDLYLAMQGISMEDIFGEQ